MGGSTKKSLHSNFWSGGASQDKLGHDAQRDLLPCNVNISPIENSSRRVTDTTDSLVLDDEIIQEIRPDRSPVHVISAKSLPAILDRFRQRPLPDVSVVFPWLHGADLSISYEQSLFFGVRPTTPRGPGNFRNIMLVRQSYPATAVLNSSSPKSNSSTESQKIKQTAVLTGSVDTDRVITRNETPKFHQIAPMHNINIRAFSMQVQLVATASDIIVYGGGINDEQLLADAEAISAAQIHYRETQRNRRNTLVYRTFVVSEPFEEIERSLPQLVAITSSGVVRNRLMDLAKEERRVMESMSRATEIHPHVFLGNTSDALGCRLLHFDEALNLVPVGPPRSPPGDNTRKYSLIIETTDRASPPSLNLLENVATYLSNADWQHSGYALHIEVPSGSAALVAPLSTDSPYWSQSTGSINGYGRSPLIESYQMYANIVRLIHRLVNSAQQHIVLLTCGDGYTETSSLALAYIAYTESIGLPDALLRMYRQSRSYYIFSEEFQSLQRFIDWHKRNTAGTPKNLAGLVTLEAHKDPENANSPASSTSSSTLTASKTPSDAKPLHDWFYAPMFNGTFPSRILPHLYLGDLNDAFNAPLLRALGITHVVSVGENPHLDQYKDEFKTHYISGIADDGIDGLWESGLLARASEFIEDAHQTPNGKCLVHCRVGVSRSATVCIAHVMSHLGVSLPEAYVYVRARRLNIVIQPNVRLMYDLWRYERMLWLAAKGPRSDKLARSDSAVYVSSNTRKQRHGKNTDSDDCLLPERVVDSLAVTKTGTGAGETLERTIMDYELGWASMTGAIDMLNKLCGFG